MQSLFKLLWRAVRGVLLAMAALILAIEEWGWRPLTAWAARLAQWPPLARLEARIRVAPPGVALALFLLPTVLLFPVKLLALWLMHMGRTGLGVSVIIAAKLLGTALIGRLFIITEPQLVQFRWFARALQWWRDTKRRVHTAVLNSSGWRAAQRWRRLGALCLRRRLRGAR